MFGDVRIQDALTKDINIIAFDFKSYQPRIFSKFTANLSDSIYDVGISNAA